MVEATFKRLHAHHSRSLVAAALEVNVEVWVQEVVAREERLRL